ncbi:MAG: glutaminyl-peptide cyclotransferase [Chitinophagaceae bacterium]|nr:glutaminyl-peptide cyclotransferase [Chitinophagaceae bacterium]
MKKYSAIWALIILAACNGNGKDVEVVDETVKPKPTPVISYSVVAEYPHDTSAYTQGLEFHNGKLYEGTGDYETSSLRITDYKTGTVEKKHVMGTNKIFGEGITIFKNKIYQLTWEDHIVYVYDVNNIDKPIQTFKWPYAGWGITNNGTDLIISDGTVNLYFVNADDFRLKSTISVSDNAGSIDSINELEYIDGFVYANIYQRDEIIKIDPNSGHVVGKMDLSGFKQKFFANQDIPGRTDVLNGIAYDSATKKFLVTGKRWPKMFELKFN